MRRRARRSARASRSRRRRRGGAVTFSSSGACSNVGAVFTMTSGTGTCSVRYDQAGSANYNAAPQVVESVTAQKVGQTITVTTHAPASARVRDELLGRGDRAGRRGRLLERRRVLELRRGVHDRRAARARAPCGTTRPATRTTAPRRRSSSRSLPAAPQAFTLTVTKSGTGTRDGDEQRRRDQLRQRPAPRRSPRARRDAHGASPASGSTFTGWSGACSGGGSCTVTMDAAKTGHRDLHVLVDPPPPTKKVYCVVPNVKGKTLAAAKRKLTAAHCKVGKTTKAKSKTVKKGNVISQSPKAGKKLATRARRSTSSSAAGSVRRGAAQAIRRLGLAVAECDTRARAARRGCARRTCRGGSGCASRRSSG